MDVSTSPNASPLIWKSKVRFFVGLLDRIVFLLSSWCFILHFHKIIIIFTSSSDNLSFLVLFLSCFVEF